MVAAVGCDAVVSAVVVGAPVQVAKCSGSGPGDSVLGQ